ncbi:hypothetical protein M758_UG019600 [Ceratodon purpureus]|nr:hypothetical protein M758_UG019600 [Ceratodon purpureus]
MDAKADKRTSGHVLLRIVSPRPVAHCRPRLGSGAIFRLQVEWGKIESREASYVHLPPRLSLGRLASLTHSGTDCKIGSKWVCPEAAQLRSPCSGGALSANASAATSTGTVPFPPSVFVLRHRIGF